MMNMETFGTAHIDAVAECIQTKPRGKFRVLWESIAISKNELNEKKTSLINKKIQQI